MGNIYRIHNEDGHVTSSCNPDSNFQISKHYNSKVSFKKNNFNIFLLFYKYLLMNKTSNWYLDTNFNIFNHLYLKKEIVKSPSILKLSFVLDKINDSA